MGILDEAIREHLELKRQHGADDSELKKLEDDAFGPTERPGSGEEAPDPLAEAPTEFMSQPEGLEGDATSEGEREPLEADAEPGGPRACAAGVLDPEGAPAPNEPRRGEQPAGEHEAVPEPVADEAGTEEHEPAADASEEEPAADTSEDEPHAQEGAVEEATADEPAAEQAGSHTTEERHAIAEHPTELYDVEGEFSVSGPSDEEEAPAASADLEEEDFFSEQRLSEELDQALEAPTTISEAQPEVEDEQRFEDEPADEGKEVAEEAEPAFEDDQPRLEQEPSSGRSEGSDVLEGTPDFLEEAPEDDELWFEQKPPKDFDFDD
jgi:CapZ-interacting protein